MATDTVVRARINAATKEKATEALAAMGLSFPMRSACCWFVSPPRRKFPLR